jgi:hypothetical protein
MYLLYLLVPTLLQRVLLSRSECALSLGCCGLRSVLDIATSRKGRLKWILSRPRTCDASSVGLRTIGDSFDWTLGGIGHGAEGVGVVGSFSRSNVNLGGSHKSADRHPARCEPTGPCLRTTISIACHGQTVRGSRRQ